MNGSSSIEEGDKQPLHCCPVCLAKSKCIESEYNQTQNNQHKQAQTTVHHATRLVDKNLEFIFERDKKLASFFQTFGLPDVGDWYRRRSEIVTKPSK